MIRKPNVRRRNRLPNKLLLIRVRRTESLIFSKAGALRWRGRSELEKLYAKVPNYEDVAARLGLQQSVSWSCDIPYWRQIYDTACNRSGHGIPTNRDMIAIGSQGSRAWKGNPNQHLSLPIGDVSLLEKMLRINALGDILMVESCSQRVAHHKR